MTRDECARVVVLAVAKHVCLLGVRELGGIGTGVSVENKCHRVVMGDIGVKTRGCCIGGRDTRTSGRGWGSTRSRTRRGNNRLT